MITLDMRAGWTPSGSIALARGGGPSHSSGRTLKVDTIGRSIENGYQFPAPRSETGAPYH